jgi:hypothetical protein
MNKYLIVVVVSVLALTGWFYYSSKEDILSDCYAESEKEVRDVDVWGVPAYEKGAREKYGVNREGYITQAGRDRCKRLIEAGELG